MPKIPYYPLKQRLRYAIDNYMSRGSSSIFMALLLTFLIGFLIMVLVRLISNSLLPDETLSSWLEIPWRVYVAVMEGSAAETDGDSNWLAKLSSILGVLVGLILFSSMVAFITSVFEAKLDELRRGRSIVLENDHTLILGFGDRILEIIRELIEANDSEPDAAIVILAEDDKEDMDNYIRDNILDFKTTRVITRSGVVTNINNLKKVMAENSKSIIIINSAASWQPEQQKTLADALVLKSIMSIIAVCEGKEHPPIICEIHSDRDRDLAQNISNGTVKALNEVSVLSRMIAQLALSRNGLSVVYGDMVGFDGNEFYFFKPKEGWSKNLTFEESINRFKSSTPMGIHTEEGKIILNPPKDKLINADDELIIFAEDDSTIKYFNKPVFSPTVNSIPKVNLDIRSQRVALLNWTPKTKIIVEKLCSYLTKHSEIQVYVSSLLDEMENTKKSLADRYPDIKITIQSIDFNEIEDLENINPKSFDSILILSPGGATIEEMDAYVISLLIRIRQILLLKTGTKSTNYKWPKLITEVMDSENIDIILNSGVEDFMVSNQFVSQIMAQVSEEPLALDVYDDLFRADGSEIYIKPAYNYFDFSDTDSIRIEYGECMQAAQLRNEIILGLQFYKKQKDKESMFGIKLIPDKSEVFTISTKDGFVALAQDEG
ncbi:MAG: hypothetical protein CBE24_03755 [bacterium TMED264]|nr:MAG: hypothetical protein CBE24_03755 [bacterium TMED264]